jgi:hypothetical protein
MNIKLPPDNLNEWETDSENSQGNPYEYYRMKYDNVTKVKTKVQKLLRLCSRKYKKMDPESHEKLKNVNEYLSEEVEPTFGIKSEKLYTEEEFDKVFLVGDEYNVIKKPEIGSCLIFELSNKTNSAYSSQPNNLNLIAISNEYFEATTKIFQRSRLEEANKPKVKKKISKERKNQPPKKAVNPNTNSQTNSIIKQLQLKRNLKLRRKLIGKTKVEEETGLNNTSNYNSSNTSNIPNGEASQQDKQKKRRKRKKHKKYIRNSTIITINKIK